MLASRLPRLQPLWACAIALSVVAALLPALAEGARQVPHRGNGPRAGGVCKRLGHQAKSHRRQAKAQRRRCRRRRAHRHHRHRSRRSSAARQPRAASKHSATVPQTPSRGAQPATAAPGIAPVGAASPGEPIRFFSPTSIWNAPVPADAPVDPDSAAMVRDLGETVEAEIRTTGGPAIATTYFGVPIYTVPAGQPTVPVALRPDSTASALRTAWEAVPLPAGAEPAAGTDNHLVVWQPATDKLWEFWRLSEGPEGWRADWGGAIEHVSTSSGVYGPAAWPGATPFWGASASSLSVAGGLIMLGDLESGEIDHALAISLPKVRAGSYALPAQRTDGKSSDPNALPEGAHLRLDPSLDLSSLGLPPLTLMIARAAQRYGFVVRDGSSATALIAQDPTPTGTNPYAGPNGLLEEGKPLAAFPWSHLEVLRMELSGS